MPAIACSGPMIGAEPESVVLGARDWRKIDHSSPLRRFPLVPIKNKTNCRFQTKICTPVVSSIQSCDSENDLAAMVHDFIENGEDGYDSSDKESVAATGLAYFDKLKALMAPCSATEKELRGLFVRGLFAMSEERDVVCSSGMDCNSRCIRSFLLKRLRSSGLDAGLCKSRWQSVGRVPGGEYEYIDVETGDGRLIVDLDFRSHFEIARPIQNYKAALRLLPTLFIGSACKLKQILQVMSEAAKYSLKQSSMHLPPWRTFNYMAAKWLSPYQRETDNLVSSRDGSPGIDIDSAAAADKIVISKGRCSDQLKRTKACLRQEVDNCSSPVIAAAQSTKPGRRHNPLRRGSC